MPCGRIGNTGKLQHEIGHPILHIPKVQIGILNKPSVKEKLDRYKAAAKAEKEAERIVPEASKEKPKTPEANRQTVHRQPKKSKKPKER